MAPYKHVVFIYHSQCSLFPFAQLDCFGACVEFVRNRWRSLESGSFSFEFSYGDLRNCVLDGDADFNMMMDVVNDHGSDRLEISVKEDLLMSSHKSSMICNTSDKVSCNFGDDDDDDDVRGMEIVQVPKFVESRDDVDLDITAAWATLISDVGQCFEGGAKEFRESLSKYCIKLGFDFVYENNATHRISAHCKFKDKNNCPWRVYARVEPSNGFMYIHKLVNDHTCGFPLKSLHHHRLTSDIVSQLAAKEMKTNLTLNPIGIVRLVKRMVGMDITYKIAHTAFEKAKGEVFGDPALSYNKINPLLDSIRSQDPNSLIGLEYEERYHTFKRCVVAFGACIHAFSCCRPLLFLDGTFLSNKFKGHLLSAVAKDGNKGK